MTLSFRFGTVGSPIGTPKKPGGSVGAIAFSKKSIKEPVGEDFLWKPTNIELDLGYDLLSKKRGKPMSGDYVFKAGDLERTGALDGDGVLEHKAWT